ncbi:glycolate oxidase FAD binding subunit [Melghirimyces profundicolus]|uniref:Glycolate oxidase FAD binding subunit n=1 Tax=Melghirimyces profundicolus TaxID=1242148 RepID=A0A2T6BW67_9BACL|nr:FAD-binding oxidoreductase [Melghirimyces profundicolus]PTX60324.1 glycolate oxidase FAD binding subunit [Melghirimyces profundicolus]
MTAMALNDLLPAERISRSESSNPLGNSGDWIAQPRTENEIADLLRHADEKGWKVTVTGGGSKRGYGGLRERYDMMLSLADLRGVVEHRRGDMTVTVRAGTPIRELADHLAEHGQRLPCDPRWPGTATIGGVVAANETGPRRLAFGAPRDFVLGLRVICPDGRILRTGGKVVKNVAGYDMNKLFVGSMGTLGVMSEITVKLRPLPPDQCLMYLTFPEGSEADIEPFLRLLRSSTLEPFALEVLNPVLAEKTAGVNRYTLAVAFEDRSEAVDDQVKWVRDHLPEGIGMEMRRGEEALRCWEAWAELGPRGPEVPDTDSPAAAAKIGLRSTETVSFIREATEKASDRGLEVFAHGGAGHGIARIWLRGTREAVLPYLAELRSVVEERRGFLVADHLPFEWRKRLDVWGNRTIPFGLMKRIKDSCDPNRTLNDQRFVGGI